MSLMFYGKKNYLKRTILNLICCCKYMVASSDHVKDIRYNEKALLKQIIKYK